MNKLSGKHSFRMPQELYTRTKKTAVDTGISVGEAIRMACRKFNERDSQVEKAKKILACSKPEDMQRIRFPGNQAYVTNKMALYVHKNADSDMQSMSEKAIDTVMAFMMRSMSDGTLLSKSRTESSDGPHIVSFKVHLFDVYCEVGPGQITIVSVL